MGWSLRSKALPIAAILAVLAALPVASQATAAQVMAGVGVVDATWHVGASAGQYAGDHPCDVTDPEGCADESTIDRLHNFDPNFHQTRRAPSYGVQSRNSVRVLVIEGTDGTRVALMKNDLYIPQDLLNERVASILEDRDRLIEAGIETGPKTGITHANLVSSVSHNHSSPYYSTPSWGVWAFQDVFDLRFFEYMAQRSAEAVVQAVSHMVPVRMGATTVPYDHAQRHSFGPAIADDGTPAGYPNSDNDKTISILRFDDVSDPAAPAPLAIYMNLGLHPEFLEGNNLITGDYIAPLERMLDRATGATLVFAQNNTGTSEPARNCVPNGCAVRAEYSHREYAQAERGARTMADAVLAGWNAIGAGQGIVPFSDDFAVGIEDRQFAPPYSHPYPSVSNCRSPEAFDGNPGVPILGLPDCERITGGQLKPVFDMLGPLDPGVTYDTLRAAGVPLPDNYGALSYTGLQETFQVHLQAVRLGNVAITVCPCEQWADQSRNIKTRLDKTPDNEWEGYDWPCASSGATWTCPNPRGGAPLVVSDYKYRRMRAQVHNDARGWDELANTPYAESEPVDPGQIRGNFTHEEYTGYGYDLVMPVGMSNDYWGYIASYREYQRGDHYRKALTGLGAHSSDWLATRLSRMAASMNGCPASLCPTDYNALDTAYMVDGVHQRARAEAIGRDAGVYLAAYEALLPPDGGTPHATAQPAPISRFDATAFGWVGGGNYTDDPRVHVERFLGGEWRPYADQSGEVVVTLDLPDLEPDDVAAYLTGSFEWQWRAVFEAFTSDIDGGSGTRTPSGTYRFVVDGNRRAGRADVQPYHLESDAFTVSPWDGIEVTEATVSSTDATFRFGPANTKTYTTGYPSGGSTVTATVGPIDYPDTWRTLALPSAPESGDKLFPRLQRTAVVDPGTGTKYLYCFPCTFRPWADAGRVSGVTVTVEYASGGSVSLAATEQPDGSWRVTFPQTLQAADRVLVPEGAAVDAASDGNYNGEAFAQVLS